MNQTDNEEELRFSQETDGSENTQWKGILTQSCKYNLTISFQAVRLHPFL